MSLYPIDTKPMGLNYDKTRKNTTQFMSLTDFTPAEFDELVIEFRVECEQFSSHFTLEGKTRQRIALPRRANVLPGV